MALTSGKQLQLLLLQTIDTFTIRPTANTSDGDDQKKDRSKERQSRSVCTS